MAPFGLLAGWSAALFGIFCFGIMGSRRPDSSGSEVVGDDDEAGLGGNRLIGGPEGSGLRREDRDSMAVSGSGGGRNVSNAEGVLMQAKLRMAVYGKRSGGEN